MKNSCLPSGVSIGGGSLNFCEGKRELSFSMKGWTSEVWKVGKIFGVLGSSIVMEECFHWC